MSGQLAQFVTDDKHIEDAKIIGPASNILTITNAAAATLALAITASKTLTLTTTDNYNLTIPATGTVALLATANVFTANQTISNTAPVLALTDTTARAKSLTIAVDADMVDLRESAGAAASLLRLDLTNNRVGIGNATPSAALVVGTSDLVAGYPASTFIVGSNSLTEVSSIAVGRSGFDISITTDELDFSPGLQFISPSATLIFDIAGYNVGWGGNLDPGALLDMGIGGVRAGKIRLRGLTSGYIELTPPNLAGSSVITFPAATGTIALTANKLSAFAATTSLELAGVISDETGSGALVFGTAPLFKTTINLNNPADTFKYVITPAAIAADRILNLPLMTGTDTLVLVDFAQTLTNKTLTAPILGTPTPGTLTNCA